MPQALVLYHYFHPDDVVSAQHYADLALGLKDRGWDVTVLPCNRGCRDESRRYPPHEQWRGVAVDRVWRPKFPQATTAGRALNAMWMAAAWSAAALRRRPDVLVVGTDPVFSVLVALAWRLLRPRTSIFHWCFDLHPEAGIAEGMLREDGLGVRAMMPLLRRAYRSCRLIGSLGPCMTTRLLAYEPRGDIQVFPPWALSEPPAPLASDAEERRAAFGNAALTLMYSGNFGKAHSFESLLALARRLRDHDDVRFAFSVRGNRVDELRREVGAGDCNVAFVPFAAQDRLDRRLSAADVHMVSLQPAWVGTVVPSKFQGALAAGRPILYAGPTDSSVAQWIAEYGLGWTLTPDNVDEVAGQLLRWKDAPDAREATRIRCHQVYRDRFSKDATLDRMDEELRKLLPSRTAGAGTD